MTKRSKIQRQEQGQTSILLAINSLGKPNSIAAAPADLDGVLVAPMDTFSVSDAFKSVEDQVAGAMAPLHPKNRVFVRLPSDEARLMFVLRLEPMAPR